MSQKLRMAAWSWRRWGQAAVTGEGGGVVRGESAGAGHEPGGDLAGGRDGRRRLGGGAGQVAEGPDEPADLLVTSRVAPGGDLGVQGAGVWVPAFHRAMR